MAKSTESETSSSELSDSDEYEFDTPLPTEADTVINVVQNTDPNVVQNNDTGNLLLPAGDELYESGDQEEASSESALAASTGNVPEDVSTSDSASGHPDDLDESALTSDDDHSLSLVSPDSAAEMHNLESPLLPRRSTRERRPSVWYSHYVL